VSGPARQKPALHRVVQAAALLAVFGLMLGASRASSLGGPGATIAAVGLLLLGGLLASEMAEVVGLPHLTGYIAAGVVAGPHVLHLLDHEVVEQLSSANKLALALIALAGGAELRLLDLRARAKSLAYATLTQTLLGVVLSGAALFVAARLLPFLGRQPDAALLAASLLWGVLSITRSPAALLGILTQTRAAGPVTRHAVTFVMSSDVVVVVVLALAFMLARPLIVPSAGLSLSALEHVGHELLGSVAIGTTFGLLLAAYLRLVGKAMPVVLLVTGVGVSEAISYLSFDALLVFIIAGMVVQNLSGQGRRLLHAIEDMGSVVYVVFFATAGAHLDLPLLAQLWPVALSLAAARVGVTVLAHVLSSRLAADEPTVRRYGWTPLVSQAGLALGLAIVVSDAFPELGSGFRSLAVAVVAINEVVGPVLFKWALDRAGESGKASEAEGA
jgi:Kef-type K+ transport system membrane component KefB